MYISRMELLVNTIKFFSSMPLTECVNIVENISETTKNQAKN